jgi:hypothetical protein
LSEPKDISVTQSGIGYPSVFTLQMQNASNDDYVKVEVSGLPDGVEIKQNSDGSKNCTEGIKSGGYCTITYDVSKVGSDVAGSFYVTITGLTADSLPVYQTMPRMVRNKIRQKVNQQAVINKNINKNYQVDKISKDSDEFTTFAENNSADTEFLNLDIRPRL